ncbi:ubinuclein-1 isoform X2 [Lissotriton helveticus]
MAETRRVQLSSLPVVALTPLDLKKTLASDAKDESVDAESAAAVRITLTLFEPDHKRCPEFFYPELVRNPWGKAKNVLVGEKNKGASTPFNDDEIERLNVEALAKKFEEKYGSKQRRRDRVQDLVDMGYGYDENDSFIDNSEAYDELVPASLTTKYGGFYINSGTLQFRQASESEEDFTKEKKKKSLKKRKLKDANDNPKKRRKKYLLEKEKKSKKSRFTALNGLKEKKKKKYSMSVNEMLRKFQKEKESQKKEDEQTVTSSSQSAPVVMPTQQEAESISDPLLTLFGSATATDLLEAANAMNTLSDLDLERLLNDSPDSSPFPEVEDGSEPSLGASPEPSVKPPPSVPEGLPLPLEKRITELTQAARDADGDPKHKFFTKEINAILLDIELQSRELNGSQRSSVYSHLALFLPFSKETLLKRARRLHRHEQGGWLKEPLLKLKEAICRAMPQQMDRYRAECQAHTQAKFARILEEEKEKDPTDRMCSENEDDDNKDVKRVISPRKKFQWNEEIRVLLSRVVKLKVDCFEIGKSKSIEHYLKAFLDAEVKPLWPKGWMQARTLFKESRRVTSHPALKKARKKVMTVEKTKVSSVKPDKKPSVPSQLTETTGSVSLAQAEMSCNPEKSAIHVSSSTSHSSSTGQPPAPCNKDTLGGAFSLQAPSKDGMSVTVPNTADCFSTDVRPSSQAFLSVQKVSAAASCEDNLLRSNLTLHPESLHQSLSFPMDHPKDVEQAHSEKKLGRISYKGLCNPLLTGKLLPGIYQAKQQLHILQRSTLPSPQAPIHASTTLPVKPFHLSQQQKTLSLQVHLGKQQVSKAVSSPLPQHPVGHSTKPSAKSQNFNSLVTSSSSSGGAMQVSSTSYRNPCLGIAGKHSVSSSSPAQSFRPSFLLGSLSKQMATISSTTATMSVTPSSMSTSLRTDSLGLTPSTLVKKPTPAQKLTLVAPPCGANGESSRRAQGVAKLLTSSVTSAMVCSTVTSTPRMTLKGAGGTTFMTASSSGSVLAPNFKSTNLPGALSSAPLGILSPIHSFPLHVISFTSESAVKAGVSTKDAIVTGPAPGTFHHGIHNNLKSAGGQQRKL